MWAFVYIEQNTMNDFTIFSFLHVFVSYLAKCFLLNMYHYQ